MLFAFEVFQPLFRGAGHHLEFSGRQASRQQGPTTRSEHRRAISSKTGVVSVGDSLITRRMSVLAVWRASAAWVSRNNRAFWIAITA